MKSRTIILSLLCAVAAHNAVAQETFEQTPPQHRVQCRLITISDKALKELGLKAAFNRHSLQKGEVKDWAALEAASSAFTSIETVVEAGKEGNAESVVQAMFPESFEEPAVLYEKESRIEAHGQPVYGEPDRYGTMLTATIYNAKGGLNLHHDSKEIIGVESNHYKTSIGGRTLATFPLPLIRQREVRSDQTIEDGETRVETVSYKGGSNAVGTYRLTTLSRITFGNTPVLITPDGVVPEMVLSWQRIRVSGQGVAALERAITDNNSLQELIDSEKVELLTKMTVCTRSGQEAFCSDVELVSLVESFEEIDLTRYEEKENPSSAILEITPSAPVFGEARGDLGTILVLTPELGDKYAAIDVHGNTASVVGTIAYPNVIKIFPRNEEAERTRITADMSTDIVETDELRTSIHLPPSVNLVVSKVGRKALPRIIETDPITLTDKEFAKIEKSAEAVYVYTIIRVDVLTPPAGK